MEKIFKQKNFNNLVWAPLGSRVNIYINFCLQVHFKVSAAWYCSYYLPPVSTTQCRWDRWQICHRFCWHRWCTLTCEYLREFSKKFEMILMSFSGALGKVIHDKNLKQKISWHCPFKAEKYKGAAEEPQITFIWPCVCISWWKLRREDVGLGVLLCMFDSKGKVSS